MSLRFHEIFSKLLNRSSKKKRKRGMASKPLFIYQTFFLNELCYGSLGLKEMEKFLWEGRGKSLPCWLSQFSFAKLRQPTEQTFFPSFPKEFSHFFQTYGSHSWVLLENAKKNLVFHFGVGCHASFLQNPVVKKKANEWREEKRE